MNNYKVIMNNLIKIDQYIGNAYETLYTQKQEDLRKTVVVTTVEGRGVTGYRSVTNFIAFL